MRRPLRSIRTVTDTDPNADAADRGRTSPGSRLCAGIVVALVLALAGSVALPAFAASPLADGASPATDVANETFAEQDGPDDVEALVDDVMAEQLDERGVPGATVAVVEGDDVVLAKGYGEADADAGTPVSANETAFEVGSVSKLVTWTAVMQGVEDGRLDLDEDVTVYLEDSDVEVPDTYDEPVTLRHLATHTAGFDASASPGIVTEPGEVVSIESTLAENPPDRVRPPGELVSYSNYGTALAGHVVAQAYDTTFEEYVESEIYDPLGMGHSTFAQPVPDAYPAEQAAPHEAGADGPTAVDRHYINWRPAGSMSSTASDMAAFMSAHLGEGATGGARILEEETIEELHAVQHERHPAVNGWRFGFYEYGDGDLLAHDGATTHFTSLLVLAPEEDVGVFVNYNVRGTEGTPYDVVDDVMAAYGLESGAEAADPSSDAGVADRAETVGGEYVTTMVPGDGPARSIGLLNRMSVDATAGGELVAETIDGHSMRFVETEPYVYREVDGDDVLAFDVEGDEATAMYVSSMPQTDWVPVPVHRQWLPVGAAIGAALLGFALSILGWAGLSGVRLWRRWRRSGGDSAGPDRTSRGSLTVPAGGFGRFGQPPWLARAAAAALCVVSLALVVLFVVGLSTGGQLPFALPPLSLRVAIALAYVVVVLTAATAAGSALAWRAGYWSRLARIHQTVLALLGLAFTAQLLQFGLLGL